MKPSLWTRRAKSWVAARLQSLTTQAAELLLFGLILSGQIRMRRIDGWRDLTAAAETPQAA